jgi:hypothetical protein
MTLCQSRAAKGAAASAATRCGRRPQSSKPSEGKRSRADELELSKRDIKALGLEDA